MDYINTRGNKALDHGYHQTIALFVLPNNPHPSLKALLVFSVYLIHFSLFVQPCVISSLPSFFLQISKDYIWGLGDGDDNKHTSWQTCVCANRVLEHCLNILTMRRSQNSNSKHALLYF